jgi:hypothetical protein
MNIRRILVVASAITAITAATVVGATAAYADQPTYPVMNTSEQPPDGVWFRTDALDNNHTQRITGLGIYAGEHLRVKCFAVGAAVGQYNNTIWYYGWDVERPTAPNGQSNEGWMNTHYVNDGQTANHAAPGVAQCAVATGNGDNPTPSPTPISLFYSPFGHGQIASGSECGTWCSQNLDLNDPAVTSSFLNNWAPNYPNACGQIDNAYAAATPIGRYPTTLSGWSYARLGPAYVLLKAARINTAALQTITYVILIDPGNYDDLSCDRQVNAGGAYANWLQLNPNARLVVISGTRSQQNSSKGIQESYFNPIRDIAAQNHSAIRNQVLVCNYSIDHYGAYFTGRYWISRQIGATTSSCPWLSGQNVTYKPTAGWHP